jgi:hypothetical protein
MLAYDGAFRISVSNRSNTRSRPQTMGSLVARKISERWPLASVIFHPT